MALHDLARTLLNREGAFWLLLEQQATLAHNAAKALVAFASSDTDFEVVANVIDAIEKDGDRIVFEMEARLAQALITPIDREDIQLLSNELEEILDAIHKGTDAGALVGIERPTEPMILLLDHIEEATRLIEEAVPKLRAHGYGELGLVKRRMCELHEHAQQVYRAALHRMYHDPDLDIRQLLSEREVLDDYDRAIVRCERVGSLLAHIAVKQT